MHCLHFLSISCSPQKIATSKSFNIAIQFGNNRLHHSTSIDQLGKSTFHDLIYISRPDLQVRIQQYLLDQWHQTQSKFVYAGHCRSTLGTDPIMYIPMTVHEQSRLLRWRMGWLPGKPQQCRNCNQPNSYTTQHHVVACFQINKKLNAGIHAFLNRLPCLPPKKKHA